MLGMNARSGFLIKAHFISHALHGLFFTRGFESHRTKNKEVSSVRMYAGSIGSFIFLVRVCLAP